MSLALKSTFAEVLRKLRSIKRNINLVLKQVFGLVVFLLFSVVARAEFAQNLKDSDFEKLRQSTIYYSSFDLDSAEIYLDSAFVLARGLEEPFYMGQALQLKSHHHFIKLESDSALKYCEKSILILADYPDSSDLFQAEYNLGNIYLELDDHIQALVQFKKVIRLIDENFESLIAIDKNQVDLNRAYSYVSVGLVYDHLKDYENELENLMHGLKITYKVETRESEILRAITLGNIGEAYFSLGNFEMAEIYAIAGMEAKNNLGLASVGYNYKILAKTAFGRGKMDLCLRYLEQSDKKFIEMSNHVEVNRNNFWRAKAYFRKGQFGKANDILLNLEVIYKQGYSKTELADLYDLLSEVQAAQGNYIKANEYLLVSRMIKKEVDLKNDKKMVGEFLNFFEEEEIRLNDRIQNLKNQQEKEKLELQIEGDNEKKIWVYSLFLVSIVCLVLIIVIISKAYQRNKKINQDLSHSIDEKQILFREVHHRVKNNFQIISSLLNLQQGIEEDERGKKVLTDAQGRIQSMSLVHELLYRKNEVKKIDFRSYTEELVSSILHSFSTEEGNIAYNVDCQEQSFDLEMAVPLGLILNEAITNSVKYAFKDNRKGKIEILLSKLSDDQFELLIIDNGIGIPEEFINGSKETLGIELISILSEQLGGSVEITNHEGTKIKIRFSTI